MKDLLHDPVLVSILAGIVVSLALSLTRFPKGALLAVTLVSLATIESAIFDGKRHLTEKFDATFLAWGRVVELRAVAGVGLVLLAGSLGKIISKLVGRGHGVLLGVLLLGPFGLGLLASSISLQIATRTILSESTLADVRLAQLRTAIRLSTWLVGCGTMASAIACIAVGLAVAMARGPSRRAPPQTKDTGSFKT